MIPVLYMCLVNSSKDFVISCLRYTQCYDSAYLFRRGTFLHLPHSGEILKVKACYIKSEAQARGERSDIKDQRGQRTEKEMGIKRSNKEIMGRFLSVPTQLWLYFMFSIPAFRPSERPLCALCDLTTCVVHYSPHH